MFKILVPVDLSECSEDNCLFGIHLAEKLNAEMHLLHCYKDIKISSKVKEVNDLSEFEIADNEFIKNETDASERLNDIVTGLEKHLDNLSNKKIPFYSKLVNGYPSREIVKYSESLKPDLLLLSTKSIGDKVKKLLGSLTYHIINFVKVPVLSIPENTALNLNNEISLCIVCNFNNSEVESINSLVRLMSGFKVKFTILHIGDINTDDEKKNLLSEFETLLKEPFGSNNVKIEVLETDNKVAGIREFAKINNIDIVSLTIPHRGFLSKLFHIDIAKGLFFNFDKPILFFHS